MTTPIGSVSLTVNTPGVFQGAPPMGAQGLVISNESPFNVVINLQGTAKGGTLLPETVDFFPIVQGFNGNVTYSPTSVVTNPASYTAATLSFEVVGLYESINRSSYPIALTRPAVTPTASGKPIFSATAGFGSTAHVGQQLNVFNPSNSGVNFTFHSVRVFTNDTTTPTANLMFTTGGDLNFSTAVAAVSHDGRSSSPVSFAHCTSVDTATQGFTQTSTIEVLDYPSGVQTQDLLAFPDEYILEPGGNLTIQLSSGATGKVVRLTMKWTEDIAIVPQGGVPTGVVMTSIVNKNNPAPTPVVTASPTGDGSTATLINNDGTMTLGDSLHTGTINLADAGAAAFAALAADGTGSVNLAALLSTKQIGLFVGATKVGHIDNGGIHLEAGAFGFDGSASTLTTGLFKFLTGSVNAWAKFTGTATTVATFFNHGLGVIPDVVLIQLNGLSSTAHSITADYASMTTTQVKLQADGNNAFVGLAIKF